ncbi:MAG: putative molybdenum carrier protein [Chromatiaceae bacterium]
MSGLVDKLKLKEQAEEDVYFARRDRELLRAKGESAPRPDRDRPTVVSGGQTGVDRGALAAALELGLAVGGWCPAGRRAEDGAIPDSFPLQETPSSDYPERTDWNVRDSDATLILHRGPLSGGTRLTAELARHRGRPLLCRDLQGPLDPAEIAHWLHLNRVRVLNCAGPRESQAPGITEQARSLLLTVFRLWIAADA